MTVSTSGPIPSQSFAVSVGNQVPEVRYVMPSVQVAGKPSRVRVRGVGFDAIAVPSALEPVEGVTGATVTRLSDTALVVDLPAVAAGERRVRIPSALGAGRAAALHHVDPETLTSARVNQVGLKHALLVDARRRAVLTVNGDQGAIVRFAQVDGAWRPAVRAIAGLRDLGLSPDGDLLVAVDARSVRLLDPVTLADVQTYPVIAADPFSSTYLGLATLNDGRVLLPGTTGFTFAVRTFDLETRAFGTIDSSGLRLDCYGGPWYAASRDGDRVVIVQSSSYTPTPPGLLLDVTAGNFYEGSLSDDGSRFVANATVYDGSFGTIGRLTLPPVRAGAVAWFVEAAVMAPDGSRAYVLAYPDTYLANGVELPRVFVFDTRAVPTGGPDLPVLRVFDVPEYPSCRSNTSTCYPGAKMAISPDERTLFILGSEALLVVPVPP